MDLCECGVHARRRSSTITGRRLVSFSLATRCFQPPPVHSMQKRKIHHQSRWRISNGICMQYVKWPFALPTDHRTHTFYYRTKRNRSQQWTDEREKKKEEEEEPKAATWLIDGFAYCTWSMLITTTATRTARLLASERARANESLFSYRSDVCISRRSNWHVRTT